MARKIKFALEMKNGIKVRSNLDELRDNFDLDRVVEYFVSGKLVEWLEDRYYENEAEKIRSINKEDSNLRQKLCIALGVEYECEDDNEVDIKTLERLNEKKAILRQKTDNVNVIENAAITALNQEDLSDLIDLDESIIYLCGDSFHVPFRVTNKRYIGILGTPRIYITAKSVLELYAKNIHFENVILPWSTQQPVVSQQEVAVSFGEKNTDERIKDDKMNEIRVENSDADENGLSIEELKQIFIDSKNPFNDTDLGGVWNLFGGYRGSKEDEDGVLDDLKKKMALRLICKNKYKEKDIIRIVVTEDISCGWALTKDSFCIGGQWEIKKSGTIIIPYKDIIKVDTSMTASEFYLTYDLGNGENNIKLGIACNPYRDDDFRRLKKYLDAVKSFYS